MDEHGRYRASVAHISAVVSIHSEFVSPIFVVWVLEMVKIDVEEIGLSPFVVFAAEHQFIKT